MQVPLLHGRQVDASPARHALYQPLKWQPSGVMPVLQLGETPAFLSPICLLTAWGATFLIICRGSLLAASFLSAPFSPLSPPVVSKSQPLICLPQCPGWSERIPPSPPRPRLLSVAQATVSCPKSQNNWDWWTPPSQPPLPPSLLVQRWCSLGAASALAIALQSSHQLPPGSCPAVGPGGHRRQVVS